MKTSSYFVIVVLSKESSTAESQETISLFKEAEAQLRTFKSTKRNQFLQERETLESQLQNLKPTIAQEEKVKNERREVKKKLTSVNLKIEHIRRDWVFHWLNKYQSLLEIEEQILNSIVEMKIQSVWSFGVYKIPTFLLGSFIIIIHFIILQNNYPLVQLGPRSIRR